MEENWREKLVADLEINDYAYDLPLAQITSFRIGGPADLFVELATPGQLGDVIEYCQKKNIPWFFMGRGSNLLVRDKGIRGVVIRLGRQFSYVKVEGRRLQAGAATPLSMVAETAARHSLAGLEFASGIPGSLGGAVFMNAGAYGGEMQQVVQEVEVYLPGRGRRVLAREDLRFGYRHSALQEEQMIALAALMELTPGESGAIRAKMSDLNSRRKSKQPLTLPSAGSVFKRPEGYYAGTLIQEAGLKGVRVGDAQVSEKHTGFIVNLGQATAEEVLTLITLIRNEVRKKFGVNLEPELRVVGEE
ncbi:MAG TPA: UDP-N-acetylmuramate dehydrogenase [Firmicutes bacterium]|nr:UDP-N-acetylmuramate dehydrogenase [Bacillota bacterium]